MLVRDTTLVEALGLVVFDPGFVPVEGSEVAIRYDVLPACER